jgi:hypothetical protein
MVDRRNLAKSLVKLWALAFGFVGPKVTAKQLLNEEKWTLAIVNRVMQTNDWPERSILIVDWTGIA